MDAGFTVTVLHMGSGGSGLVQVRLEYGPNVWTGLGQIESIQLLQTQLETPVERGIRCSHLK